MERGSEVVWLHRCILGGDSIKKKRVHKVELLVMGLLLFLGTTRSKYLWYSAWQKKNTWLQVKQYVR